MGLDNYIQQVETIVSESGIKTGLIHVYDQGASVSPDDEMYWHYD
jgi:thiamine phosphate synthase YjbQ (UPF0047 family)